MEKIKILFVNFDRNIGGGQTNLISIMDNLDRSEFDIHIVCAKKGMFFDRLTEKGYRPFFVDFGKGRIRYIRYSVLAIIRLFGIMRELKIDLVHANSFNAFKITSIAAKLRGVPVVWYEAP